MKKIVMIAVVLSVVTMVATAQTFKTGADQQVMQSQQIMATGNAYSGTVYKPFDNTTPAEYNPIASAPANAPGGPRKGFGKPEDPGDQSSEYPIGDAVLPLLFMSLAFAGVIYSRKRRARV